MRLASVLREQLADLTRENSRLRALLASHRDCTHDHSQVLPVDVLTGSDLSLGTESIEIIGTRGPKVTLIGGLAQFVNLKSLCLRSNLISKIQGLSTLTLLSTLELYDNQIPRIRGLENLRSLTVLDLSFNVIKTIADLSPLTLLEEVYLASNKITKIEGVANLKHLRKLDLGANRIRVIENLDGLDTLEELWLGKNKITEIPAPNLSAGGVGLTELPKLKKLSIQSNRLTCVQGLASLECLEELYLSHNGIDSLDASSFKGLTALNTLDLGSNRIATCHHLSHLLNLVDLWMGSNLVANFEDIQPLLSLTKLETLYLEHNPLQRDFEYRLRLARMLPSLSQIDADFI